MCAAKLDSSLGSLDWLTVRDNESAPFQPPSSTTFVPRTNVHASTSSEKEEEEEESKEQQGFTKPDAPVALNFLPKVDRANQSSSGASLTYGQDGKPNLSYAELIKRAIDSSGVKKMTLNEIYKWIIENFPYYRDQDSTSWKNSIRHNLSLNKQFKKVQRERGDPGKGSYWKIDDSAQETWRARRPRSYGHPSFCPCHADEYRCSSYATSGASRCDSGANAPRINPVIQALFGFATQQAAASSSTNNESEEFQPQTMLQSSQSQGPSSEVYGSSWNSQTSSVPSNYRFPELDSSIGSVQSQLSESFKNLYHQALNASFGSSVAFHSPQASGTGSGLAMELGLGIQGSAIPQHDPMLHSAHQGISADPPGPSGTQFPGVPTEGGQTVLESELQELAADWIRHAAAAASRNVSPPPPHPEMFQSLDMDMMGSMQSRELQDLLGHYGDDLAASFKDYFSKSISVGAGCPSLNQSQTQAQIWRQWQAATEQKPLQDCMALAPTPPAVGGDVPCTTVALPVNFCDGKDLEPLLCDSQGSGVLSGMSRKGNPLLSLIKEEDDPVSSHQISTPPLSTNTESVKMEQEEDSDNDFDWEDLVNRD